MALVNSLIYSYARAVYKDGTRNFQTIRTDYVEAVKQYAAVNYDDVTIAEALDSGYITQQEYDETMAYKTA